MKRKALIVVLCVALLGALAVVPAQSTFYTATVSQAGVFGTTYYATLTDTAATPGWVGALKFFLPAGPLANACLAASLTAWSTGGKVVVWLDTTTEFSTVATVATTN